MAAVAAADGCHFHPNCPQHSKPMGAADGAEMRRRRQPLMEIDGPPAGSAQSAADVEADAVGAAEAAILAAAIIITAAAVAAAAVDPNRPHPTAGEAVADAPADHRRRHGIIGLRRHITREPLHRVIGQRRRGKGAAAAEGDQQQTQLRQAVDNSSHNQQQRWKPHRRQ